MKENKYRKETRIWCPQCRIFVHNNLVSRQNHDKSPQHLKQLQRELRNAYKLKNSESGAASFSTQPIAKKANIKDYGYDSSDFPFDLAKVPNASLNTEFKATKEFEKEFQPITYTTKIGEWEPVEDEEEIKALIGTNLQVPEQQEVYDKPLKEVELKIKTVETQCDDDTDPISFKRISKKKFR